MSGGVLRLGMAALASAFVAGALADDHSPPGGGGEPEPGSLPSNCQTVPPGCVPDCLLAEDACAGGEGSISCRMRRAALDLCGLVPPPSEGPPTAPPGTAPPPTPPGDGDGDGDGDGSESDCGDDEIGGGSEECQECGEGEAPSADGTACETCEYGESVPGTCDPPCFRGANNKAAIKALKRYPDKEPFERGVSHYCHDYKVHAYAWMSTEDDDDPCQGTVSLSYNDKKSCWIGGDKQTGCNLSIAHTHPWFTEDDFEVMCLGKEVEDKWRAYDLNVGGMNFSQTDKDTLHKWSLNGQLSVSNRSCITMYRRMGVSFGTVSTIDGKCEQPEPPEDEGESQE